MTLFRRRKRARSEYGRDNRTNREAWLEKTLAAVPAGSRILDAGAGELQYRKYCEHLNYVSQDFGQYEGGEGAGLHPESWDNSKLDLVCDITEIPEPDESFDAVMCIEVFEHLPEPVNALRELVRLTKPGGSLILTAPFCSLTHFAPFHFASGLSRFWYEHWAKEFGLGIEDLELSGNYFSYIAQELRRVRSIQKRYAKDYHWTKKDSAAIADALQLVERAGRLESGSSELLCYGVHVRAKKLPG